MSFVNTPMNLISHLADVQPSKRVTGKQNENVKKTGAEDVYENHVGLREARYMVEMEQLRPFVERVQLCLI
jgi:hypothetical protein